jgi:hypothetical protein
MTVRKLSREQRRLKREIEEISGSLRMDHWNNLDYPQSDRLVTLKLVIRSLVNQEIIWAYTLVDEYLGDIICNYYFKRRKNEVTHRKLWRDTKFKIFNHYIMDEIYLLQKLPIVHAMDECQASIEIQWKQ